MKLSRIYIVVSTLILSATVFVSCFFMADENARKTGLGEDYPVVALELTQDFSVKQFIEGISKTVKETIENAVKQNEPSP